jgi:hypothetical protein
MSDTAYFQWMSPTDKPLVWLHGEVKTPPFSAVAASLEASMDEAKRARLEEAGWKVGSAAEFLELSDDEAAFVELKLGLSEALRERRTRQGLTQVELAKRIGSSQSR